MRPGHPSFPKLAPELVERMRPLWNEFDRALRVDSDLLVSIAEQARTLHAEAMSEAWIAAHAEYDERRRAARAAAAAARRAEREAHAAGVAERRAALAELRRAEAAKFRAGRIETDEEREARLKRDRERRAARRAAVAAEKAPAVEKPTPLRSRPDDRRARDRELYAQRQAALTDEERALQLAKRREKWERYKSRRSPEKHAADIARADVHKRAVRAAAKAAKLAEIN